MQSIPSLMDAAALARFDRPGPRYTSYPTAVVFGSEVGPDAYREALAEADRRAPHAPLALYVHLPFCRERCTFCGCHVVATSRRDVAARYLEALTDEASLLASALPQRRRLGELHLGGGTPTYYDPSELRALHAAITAHFAIDADAELTAEVDPRVTTAQHIDTLASLGFSRLSIGVQDFTPEVQAAIGRNQTAAETSSLVAHARRRGFSRGINVDLVYGLPAQTPAAFERNLDQVVELRPDRLALYSFAYVPWQKGHQKRLPLADLPDAHAKLALHRRARERLLEAGYEAIGMDHFALPDDPLAAAARSGRLRRTFMGYTTQQSPELVALGISGISELAAGFFQNAKKLSTYHAMIARGELPVERGRLLDEDDRIRRDVITQLMCNFRVDKGSVSRTFGVDFDRYFSDARPALAELAAAGAIEETDDAIAMRPAARLLVRNVCMAFDRYLTRPSSEGPVFSRTI